VSGHGRIVSPATFDGANTGIFTYAVIWADGKFATVRDVTIENVPRIGVYFKDAAGFVADGLNIIGNYPYASYNETTTTAHFGIAYDPPATVGDGRFGGLITGCRVSSCIQGASLANLVTGSLSAVSITDNTFVDCWDHAIYLQSGTGCRIQNNMYVDCRRPIVMDGTGNVCTGNTLLGGSRPDCDQQISVRNAVDCIVSNNVVRGLTASIIIDDVSGTGEISGNIVDGNHVTVTGRAGQGVAALRLGGATVQVMRGNRVRNNILQGVVHDINVGHLSVQTQSGYVGNDNEISGNTVQGDGTMTANTFLTNISNQRGFKFDRNTLIGRWTAASAMICFLFAPTNCHGTARGNRFIYRENGANISVRSIQTFSACQIAFDETEFDLSAASLTGKTTLEFIELANRERVSRSRLTATDPRTGTFQIASGASSLVVTNANVLNATWSRVRVWPLTAAAAALVAANGIAAIAGAGQFTATLGTGTAAANADFEYEVV
jgi:parallel beta-helix repeat protein